MHHVSQKMQLNYVERLNREVSSLGTEVSTGPNNLFVGMMHKELLVCPMECEWVSSQIHQSKGHLRIYQY